VGFITFHAQVIPGYDSTRGRWNVTFEKKNASFVETRHNATHRDGGV